MNTEKKISYEKIQVDVFDSAIKSSLTVAKDEMNYE